MEVMETEHDIRLKLIIQKLEPIQMIFFQYLYCYLWKMLYVFFVLNCWIWAAKCWLHYFKVSEHPFEQYKNTLKNIKGAIIYTFL